MQTFGWTTKFSITNFGCIKSETCLYRMLQSIFQHLESFGCESQVWIWWTDISTAHATLHYVARPELQNIKIVRQTFFLQNLRARLSLEIFSSSIALFSYGAAPQTSRIRSRTNFVCFVKACIHQTHQWNLTGNTISNNSHFTVLLPARQPRS